MENILYIVFVKALIARYKQKDFEKMTEVYPNHLSHHFELNLSRLPSKSLDRIPLSVLLGGVILGLLFIALGVYDWIYGAEISPSESLLNINLFDVVLIVIGLCISIGVIIAYFHYRKIYYDGKNITVVHRLQNNKKTSYKEPLNKYSGVRYRIEFFMFGFINRNKYIVELYHKNPQKIIPLYISTSDHQVRQKWEYFAKQLNLPAMVDTDEGLVVREIDDFGKSVKDMAQKWQLKEKFNPHSKVPNSLIVKRKDRKIIIKIRNRLWDAYSLLAWFFLLLGSSLAGVEFILAKRWENMTANMNTAYAIGALLVIGALIMLMAKEKLVLKKYKIVNVHKLLSYSHKKDEIDKDKIEAIDVAVNPASGRHYVSIISANKTIVFGKKLPIEDLRWLKNFLLYELSK